MFIERKNRGRVKNWFVRLSDIASKLVHGHYTNWGYKVSKYAQQVNQLPRGLLRIGFLPTSYTDFDLDRVVESLQLSGVFFNQISRNVNPQAVSKGLNRLGHPTFIVAQSTELSKVRAEIENWFFSSYGSKD